MKRPGQRMLECPHCHKYIGEDLVLTAAASISASRRRPITSMKARDMNAKSLESRRRKSGRATSPMLAKAGLEVRVVRGQWTVRTAKGRKPTKGQGGEGGSYSNAADAIRIRERQITMGLV